MALLLLLSVSVFHSGSVQAADNPTQKQAHFSTPEEAKQAVVNAAVAKDTAAFATIFGPEAPEQMLPGDEAEDKQELEEFAASVQQSAKLEKVNDTKFTSPSVRTIGCSPSRLSKKEPNGALILRQAWRRF